MGQKFFGNWTYDMDFRISWTRHAVLAFGIANDVPVAFSASNGPAEPSIDCSEPPTCRWRKRRR